MSNKNNRNDPCNCGSGKKYKKCCGLQALALQQLKARAQRLGPLAKATALGGIKNYLYQPVQKEAPVEVASSD